MQNTSSRQYVLLSLLLVAVAILLWTRQPPPSQPATVRRLPAVTVPDPGSVAGRPKSWPPGVIRAGPHAPRVPDDSSRRPPAPAISPSEPALKAPPGAIPGEWVYSFYNERDRRLFIEAARRLGVTVLDEAALGYSVRVRAADPAQLRRLAEEAPVPIARSPNFVTRHPERSVPVSPRRATLPSDYAGFGGHATDWIGAPAERSDWGAGITVAILDSGIGAHPALDDKRIAHLFLSDQPQPPAAGHGTAVASLVAGAGDGLQGVAPAARLLDIPILGADGHGDAFTMARGIMAAVERGAQIINVCAGTEGDLPLLRDAVAAAAAAGAVVVAAVGNTGKDGVLYPANYESVLAVSAVDAAREHAGFSSTGPNVDIAAPGIGLYAAWTNGTVIGFSGTSASVPVVSGAIAGLMSRQPGLSAPEAARQLLRYADDEGTAGPDPFTGAGIINLARVQQGDRPGVVDAAVGVPFLEIDELGNLAVNLTVQNRGTEPLKQATLAVDLGGTPQRITLYDIPPRESTGRRFLVNADWVSNQGELPVSFNVQTAHDATPANDRYNATLTVRKPQ